MNFSVIAGGGGGPGGGIGTAGTVMTGAVGRIAAGGGGGAFGLNCNKLRSVSTGFGRSTFSDSRWTSGAVGALAALRGSVVDRAAVAVAGVSDDGAGAASPRYTTTARATSSAPRRICLRR